MRIRRLTLFDLKIITLIAMVVDHVAWAFVDTDSIAGELMHTIGRMVAPMMAYFLASGFVHSRDVMRYLGRLCAFAIISQPIFVVFQMAIGMTDDVMVGLWWGNVLFSLSMALMTLMLWRLPCANWIKLVAMLLLVALAEHSEYGLSMMLWVMIFRYWADNLEYQIMAYLLSLPVAYVLTYGMNATAGLGYMHLGMVLSAVLMVMYNGQKGRTIPSWLGGIHFFYGFYPVHLAVLTGLVWVFGGGWH